VLGIREAQQVEHSGGSNIQPHNICLRSAGTELPCSLLLTMALLNRGTNWHFQHTPEKQVCCLCCKGSSRSVLNVLSQGQVVQNSNLNRFKRSGSRSGSKKVQKKCQILTGFLKLQCSKALQLKGLVRTTSVHARALVEMASAAAGEERTRLCDSKDY
jgi:hypothetical protein